MLQVFRLRSMMPKVWILRLLCFHSGFKAELLFSDVLAPGIEILEVRLRGVGVKGFGVHGNSKLYLGLLATAHDAVTSGSEGPSH